MASINDIVRSPDGYFGRVVGIHPDFAVVEMTNGQQRDYDEEDIHPVTWHEEHANQWHFADGHNLFGQVQKWPDGHFTWVASNAENEDDWASGKVGDLDEGKKMVEKAFFCLTP